MTDYTKHQSASIDALLKGLCPDASRHDGIRREIDKALGDGPATDREVMVAVQKALVDNSAVSIPEALFPAAAATKATVRR